MMVPPYIGVAILDALQTDGLSCVGYGLTEGLARRIYVH